MTAFSKAKKILGRVAGETIGRRVSYDREKRALKIGHGIVFLAARHALKHADRIEDAAMEVAEGAYLLHLTTDRGVRAKIRMIPRQLSLEEDRVAISIRLPEGVRFEHENAVFAYMARFVDRVFGISGAKMSGMSGFSFDGKHDLTYTRRIEDFPLARVYRKYAGQGKVLPVSLTDEHLVVDLSQMFPEGFSVDLKKVLSVRELFSSGKNGGGFL